MSKEQHHSSSICFLSRSESWGGLEMNLLRYAGWMRDRGHRVVLIGVEGSSMETHAQKNGVFFIPLKNNLNNRTWRRSVLAVLGEHNAEVLWFREKDLQKQLLFLKKSGVFTLYQQGMQLGSTKKDLFHRWLYGFIDCWISPNQFMYDQASEWTHIPPTRLHKIPLGIEVDEFLQKRISKSAARQKLALNPEGILIGMIGRIDPQKNQLTGLKAFAALTDQYPKAEMLIMGDPTHGEGYDYLTDLQSFVDDYNLSGRVSFRSYTPESELFYSAVDLMVMPSLFESFGRVTLEAMCYGLPVLGANTGGTRELIGKENSQLLFSPEDSEECMQKLKVLIDDESVREELGVKLYSSAKENYSHIEVLKQIESLLPL